MKDRQIFDKKIEAAAKLCRKVAEDPMDIHTHAKAQTLSVNLLYTEQKVADVYFTAC